MFSCLCLSSFSNFCESWLLLTCVVIPGFLEKFHKEAGFPTPLSFDNVPEGEQEGIELVQGRDQIYVQIQREENLEDQVHKTSRKIKKAYNNKDEDDNRQGDEDKDEEEENPEVD